MHFPPSQARAFSFCKMVDGRKNSASSHLRRSSRHQFVLSTYGLCESSADAEGIISRLFFALSATDGLMMGYMTSVRFNCFLSETNERLRNDPTPKVLIFDNALAHLTDKRKTFNAPNNVSLK